MSDSTALASGSSFGRYIIRRSLGAGAFGAVYEATQQPLGKRVALKVLHAAQIHNAEVLQRFTAEAEATAKLRHPNVVDVLDLGAHEGVPFIAMEFLEGESLGGRLHREGRLSASSTIELLLPVVSAVATVHDSSIVHRDLKPDNIFLSVPRPGKVVAKVLDFGIAKVNESKHSMTRTGSMMGTVFYMSPEQVRESKDVDGRSDQWALAVILYECVTGRCPFPGEAMIDVLTGILSAPVPPMRDVPDLPAGFEAVLLRAMSKDREDRFPSVRAMGQALMAFASPSLREEWSAEFAGHDSSPARSEGIAATVSGGRSSMVGTLGMEGPPVPVGLAQSASFGPREIPGRAPSIDTNTTGSRRVARTTMMAGGAVALVALVAGGGFLLGTSGERRGSTAPVAQVPTPYVVAIEVTPVNARLELDGEFVGNGRLTRSLPRDGQSHRLRMSAAGYANREISFDADRRPPERVMLERVEPPSVAPLPVPTQTPRPVAAQVVRAPAPSRGTAAVRRSPMRTWEPPAVPTGAPPGGGVTSTGIEIH
jgi:serine/threonine protein kinase